MAGGGYEVDVQIRAIDRRNLLKDITTLIAQEDANVADIRSDDARGSGKVHVAPAPEGCRLRAAVHLAGQTGCAARGRGSTTFRLSDYPVAVIRDPDNDPHRDQGKRPPGVRIEPVADWLQEVEFRRPASAPPAWRDRRYWRWVAAIALMVAVAVVVFRKPLANLMWPDMRVQRLLDEADAALKQGRLSAADGTGARQRYEAALALDSDRGEARAGLTRVAEAALAQARGQARANHFEAARQALSLARELQVPRAQADAIANQLRLGESAHAGIDALVREAGTAVASGRLEAALPLYQRVLALQPNHTAALEGREDALSELLQQARKALAAGDLAGGSARVAQARGFDPGHVDLPDLEAQLGRAIEQRRKRADGDLRQLRLDRALAGYRQVLAASADDVAATQGIERVAAAYAQRAAREASDFDFVAADASLRQARELTPRAAVVKEAGQALARARQSQSRLASPVPVRDRARRTLALLAAMEQAEARGDWLTPPGESAYDKLRAAQALAPDDAAVRRAAARLLPATRSCLEDELRGNRVRRARACYEAWQTLQPRDTRLPDARRRLSQKWIAVGDERLGAGEVAFAVEALGEARALDADAPGLAEFAARVHSAQAGGD